MEKLQCKLLGATKVKHLERTLESFAQLLFYLHSAQCQDFLTDELKLKVGYDTQICQSLCTNHDKWCRAMFPS